MPQLVSNLQPTGTITSFGGTIATLPAGWLICDGSPVSRTVFSSLFAVTGTAYGAGDGSTTFHLPDLRGRFVRGLDTASLNDPDAAARTVSNSGGNTGANLGSLQADQFVQHSHSYTAPSNPGNNAVSGSQVAGGSQTGGTTSQAGGNETRPKNVYCNYIIKF